MFDWVLNPRLKQVKTYTSMMPFTAYPETVVRRCSVKKVFLVITQNSQENTWVRVSFLIKLQVCNFIKKGTVEACNFIKKETLTQVFSCEFCAILKNTFFYRKPPVAVSAFLSLQTHSDILITFLDCFYEFAANFNFLCTRFNFKICKIGQLGKTF